MTDKVPPPLPPPADDKALLFWLGGAVGIAPGLIALLSGSPNNMILPFIASITLWPLAAVILAIIRSTSRFGVGMLLGMGIGWLVFLAVCGGALAHL